MRRLSLLLQALGLALVAGPVCDLGAAWAESSPTSMEPSTAPVEMAAPSAPLEVVFETPEAVAKPETIAPQASSAPVAPVEEPEQQITVVMENRSTGCQAQVSGKTLSKLQSNLCQRPTPPATPTAALPSTSAPTRQAAAQSRRALKSAPIQEPDLATLASYIINRNTKNPTSLRTFLASRAGYLSRYPGNGDLGLLYPLPSPAAVTSAFGLRVHPITGQVTFHRGVDLGAAEGTPVLAAFAGRVAIAEFLGNLGLAVILNHSDGNETRYGHLSQVFVQPGEWVEQGQVIGAVGSTGLSTGPHLHFELWQNTAAGRVAVDITEQVQLALGQLVQQLAVNSAGAGQS
ncbi:M23 family metallopeptidase [Leptolyngbya sp. FACHB-261]|uniref:M23 family metallopeptidase n=1 Tax=Leptolyngbya sp. FACHB-261 TaxID=2692806 RepID=UPI001685A6DF|nr:M23 family metallopeptidase [Leptolyngbya sp. FACHB-261]MBD2105012.1 M23 family metallopeptidase [Leptolyngbya sp. FACHB-261]